MGRMTPITSTPATIRSVETAQGAVAEWSKKKRVPGPKRADPHTTPAKKENSWTIPKRRVPPPGLGSTGPLRCRRNREAGQTTGRRTSCRARPISGPYRRMPSPCFGLREKQSSPHPPVFGRSLYIIPEKKKNRAGWVMPEQMYYRLLGVIPAQNSSCLGGSSQKKKRHAWGGWSVLGGVGSSQKKKSHTRLARALVPRRARIYKRAR